MTSIRIEGLPPWDGEYPLDISYFTNREFHVIKEISGVRAGELADELARGNNDLIVAITVIALKRNGVDIPVDDLWDAPAGRVYLDADDEEADDDPPVSPPASGSVRRDGGAEPTLLSGVASVTTGASLGNGPSSTGVPGSETTAA